MKYLRVHKEGSNWHRCEVTSFKPADHYTDGTIPALSDIWKVFEVSDSFETDNPLPETDYIDIDNLELGMKWKHADGKWYEIKRECHHAQLYDIDTGETSCHLAMFPENIETEIV